MRTLAWCLLTLGLVGCHSGPRWCLRDCERYEALPCEDQPVIEPAPQPAPAQPKLEGPAIPATKQPDQKERVPYESSSRSRGWFGTRHASHSKSSNRATQTARRTTPAAAARPTSQDESVKQLMADLEKVKREKAVLETKLSEESAKQTQQRLELEARLALIQEQMRQQSALQQVMYQPPAPPASRPTTNYYGPVISSGTPNPSLPMPFSSSAPTYAPPSQAAPAWSNPAPNWVTPSVPPQQQVEQWPFSPQRR